MTDIQVASIAPFMLKGEDGTAVTSALVGTDGHLRVTLSDGTTVDAGNVFSVIAASFAPLVPYTSARPAGVARVIWTGGTAGTPPAALAGDLWVHP